MKTNYVASISAKDGLIYIGENSVLQINIHMNNNKDRKMLNFGMLVRLRYAI